MSFKEFLRKACTVGLSTSMLFGCLFSPVNAEMISVIRDTTFEAEGTARGKLVTINCKNGGKVRIQLFSSLKYSKGLKQKLIDFVANQLVANDRLWLRYTFTDAEGNLRKTSDWKEYVGDETLDDMVVEEEGKYDIRYVVTSDVAEPQI